MLILSIFRREDCKSTRVNIDIRYAEERVIYRVEFHKKN